MCSALSKTPLMRVLSQYLCEIETEFEKNVVYNS
jgi:hypothetical protein